MSIAPLLAAELAFDGNGTPCAPAYGDIYHPAGGGLAQARHVFLGGNGLLGTQPRWAARENFNILETGFGLGTNFLATWHAWRNDPQRPTRLNFFSVEKHPFAAADLELLHQACAELAPLAAQLRAAWPSRIAGFHRLHFDAGQVTLTLIFGDAQAAIPRISGRFDAFYLDGFAPDRNPELWSQTLIDDLAWLAAPGATLASWCVAGAVKRRLASAEFSVKRRRGCGAKSQMLTASHPGNPHHESAAPGTTPHERAARRIAIIGAGIAGITCAERLARRGWQVTLFDRHDGPAAETSGNHQAILLPVLAVDETRLARLNRVAFLYVLRRLQELAAAGHPVDAESCGVFQIARHPDHATKQRAIVTDQQLPEDFVRFIGAEEARQRVGTEVSGDGWWFPQAGWLSPLSLCRALLASAGPNLDFRPNSDLARLDRTATGWQLTDPQGNPLWDGPAVVLAHAHGIRELEQSAHLPLRCFRGQVSHLPAAKLGDTLDNERSDAPRSVVCREGYLAPPYQGIAGLGATFQRSHDRTLTADDHRSNLSRLAGMLPALADRFDAEQLSGRVGLRPVSPDKLPMVGALPLAACEPRPAAHVEWPRHPGLFVASGYGARGFVWAPLMAELLASQISGDPLPVDADLAAAVDPARFVWKGTP